MVLGGVVASELFLIFGLRMGLPGTPRGSAEFQTGELVAGITISQTFQVHANGLDGVTLYPVTSTTASGGFVVALSRVGFQTDKVSARLVERKIGAAELGRRSSWVLAFAPVANSYGDFYRLDLTPQAGASGIRLRAVGGDGYRDGMMLISGQGVPADLKFTASATRASVAARLAARVGTDLRATALLISAAILVNAGLALLLLGLATAYSPRP